MALSSNPQTKNLTDPIGSDLHRKYEVIRKELKQIFRLVATYDWIIQTFKAINDRHVSNVS